MPHTISQPLNQSTLDTWHNMVKRAKAQKYHVPASGSHGAAVHEVTTDVYQHSVSWAILKAINEQWTDPLGERPVWYILRLELYRKMEARREAVWEQTYPNTRP